MFTVSFSVIYNLGTPSFELQINFDVMQIDTENSATGLLRSTLKLARVTHNHKCSNFY